MSDLYIVGENDSEFEYEIIIQNLTINDSLTIKNIVPDSIEISPSTPNMSSGATIQGRSSPPVAYSGGGERSVGFTLTLHRDLFEQDSEKSTSDEYQRILDWFDALNYPSYTSSGVVPPNCYCKLGNTTSIKGYATVSYQLARPIDRYGRYMKASVQISITEALNVSWDATEILDGCVSRKEVPITR